MKKRSIFFLASVLLVAAAGCVRDFTEPAYDDTDGKVTFRVGLSIADAQPLATRAILGDAPERPEGAYLQKLKYYLFVFEDNGSPQTNYLRELVYGSDIHDLKIASGHDHAYANPDADKPLLQFTARLDGTAENAIIHIVATADPDFEEQLRSVPDRSEFGIFTGANGLYTAKNEAYWRRIELDRPIASDDANKTAIQAQLSHVNMVRNFSRVTLKISEDAEDVMGFVPEAFVVVNSVDAGYVAAYNENLGDDGRPGFVDFEAKADTEPYGYLGTQRTYRDLTDNEQYVPSRHPASKRQYADDDIAWTASFEGDSGDSNPESNMLPKYMFERAVQNDHKTFVVVKGRFPDQDDPTYIKLDIGTIDPTTKDAETGEPFGVFETFNLIRNFSYDITITHIRSKSVGHASAESALGAPPANNISTSIETRPLTTIYDGVDKMMVNQTTIVIVDQDGENGALLPNPKSFTMMWRYEKDYYKNPSPVYNSESVKWNYPGYDFAFKNGSDPDGVIASWVGASGSVSTETPVNLYTSSSPDARNDSKEYGNDWRGFELNFLTPGDVTREKTIRLYQPNGLTRDVTFISHKRWEFVDRRPDGDFKDWNVEVFPGSYSYANGTMPYESLEEMRAAFKGYSDYQDADFSQVGSQRGAQMTLIFELPADLPEAIFPLDFKIGADRQNIENAYVGNAVATWGKSLFENDPDPIGVMRMQFIKTVTWEDYQQHRLVCVRFLTTTDVLNDADDNYSGSTVQPDEEGNVIARTRVRVTNPYFKPGNDVFERSSHQDVIDPTRGRWHWNFTYPEWSTYFSTYYQKDDDPLTLNNLHFKNYDIGNTSSGIYMNVDIGNAEAPDIWFPVNSTAQDSQRAGTISIKASPQDSERTGYNFLGTGGTWHRYHRFVYVRVIFDDETYVDNLSDPMFYHDDGSESKVAGNYTAPAVISTNTWTFTVPANKSIQEVRIWSDVAPRFTENRDTGVFDSAPTRYYDILFTLD